MSIYCIHYFQLCINLCVSVCVVFIRYKIFIEGNSWSVSQKYILACDSMTLLVSPRYYDIITRSLLPLTHYWPIRENAKCKSLKFAVNWGNNHQEEVIVY